MTKRKPFVDYEAPYGVPPKKEKSVHAEFAERAQLLRWCHERSIKELKALRKAFDMSKATNQS